MSAHNLCLRHRPVASEPDSVVHSLRSSESRRGASTLSQTLERPGPSVGIAEAGRAVDGRIVLGSLSAVADRPAPRETRDHLGGAGTRLRIVLHLRQGFRATGEVHEGELVLKLDLPNQAGA